MFHHELTPVGFLERAGSVHSDRVAVVDGGVSFTYREWQRRSRRFASALRRAGLRKGDRVAFLALNSEPLLLAHFAVPQAGGVLVAINTRLTEDEVRYIVDHSGARQVFVSKELLGRVARVQGVEVVSLGSEFEHLLAAGSVEPVESWLDTEQEPIALDYTSGTTGRPKGVIYHHRGAYLNALGMVIENRLSPESSFLWTLPMFHCNGWSHTWAVAAAGARSVCIPGIDPARVWQMLETERITHFNAAPTVLIMLMSHPAAHRLAHRVRVCTGGAAPSPTLISRMAELNLELVHLYGLTETFGPATINHPKDGVRAGGTSSAQMMARQGLPHITVGSLRVVDEQMNDVPADGATMGEIVFRGNTVMQGYFRQPDDTEKAFQGGWLHTGDLAVMHDDGSVEIRDRSKDIIISGGENISSIEIEQVIATHPAVLESAVVALPDEFWGEIPKAFVTLNAGATASEQEIIEHCRRHMAHFKCPKAVEFGDLPKTSTGKIQKYLLRTQGISSPAE